MMVEVDAMTSERPARNERTCVGCGKHAAREDLVRLVLDPSTGRVVVDAKDSAHGRGAHVHPSVDCISSSRKGLSRSFKQSVEVDVVEVASSITAAFARRIEGLLSGGARARLIAIGNDAVREALRATPRPLVLVAADARVNVPPDALVFGDKMRLARALGKKSAEEREGVAICAVTNVALATAVRRAWLCSTSVSTTTMKKSLDVHRASGAGGSTG